MIGDGRPFHLIAYVIMPEHVHLLVWPGHERGGVDENGRWQPAEKVEWGPIAGSIKSAGVGTVVGVHVRDEGFEDRDVDTIRRGVTVDEA